jgi:hypothetical protein
MEAKISIPEIEYCEHDFENTGEDETKVVDFGVVILRRAVKCKKCRKDATDVFVYIGTFNDLEQIK